MSQIPEGLSAEGWLASTGYCDSRVHSSSAIAELLDGYAAYKVEALQREIQMRDGTLSMAVARLGGTVEGNPTGRHNFLQRIDELVAKEAKG